MSLRKTARNRFSINTLLACLLLVSVGCGGGGGGTVATGGAPAGATTSVSGNVPGASNATVTGFRDSSLNLQVAGALAVTGPTGSFTMTISDAELQGVQTLYFSATGGSLGSTVLKGAVDVEANVSKTDSSPFGLGLANVLITELSTLIVELDDSDPGASFTSAISIVASIFGLTGSELNVNDVGGLFVAQANKIFQDAADLSGKNLKQYIKDFAQALVAGGTADDSFISQLQTADTGLDNNITIGQPKSFKVTQLQFQSASPGTATESLDLLNAPILVKSSIRTATLTSAVTFSGGVAPTVSIDFTGISSFPNTTFKGAAEMNITPGSGQAFLKLEIDQLNGVTSGNTAILSVPVNTATLTASGRLANGDIATTVTTTNLEQDTDIDLFNTQDLGNGQFRLTFNAKNILARIRSKLGGLNASNSSHPISLLETAGTYTVNLVFQGFPVENANGRLTAIEVINLTFTN